MPKNAFIPRALLAAGFLAALGPAFAQGAKITPQSIIVNPAPTDLSVSVNVDRAGDNPAYNIGDAIRVSVTPNQDAYVYIFSVHADGKIDLVLPNRYSGGEALVHANETRSFPPKNAAFKFTIGGPAGQDKVLAVAAKHALNIDEIAQFEGNAPLATVKVQGQENLARALSIVVEPIPPADWITDVTYYRVIGSGAATPVTPPPAVTPAPSPTPAPRGPLTAADFVRGFDTVSNGQTLSGLLNVGPRLVLTNRSVNGVDFQRAHFTLVDSSGYTVWSRDESTQSALCVNGNGNSASAACYAWDLRPFPTGDYTLNAQLSLSNNTKVTYSVRVHIVEQGSQQTFVRIGSVTVPVYPGSQFQNIKNNRNGKNASLTTATFQANGTLGLAGTYYLNYFAARHWKISSTDISNGKYWFTATKGNLKIQIELRPNGKNRFTIRAQIG